MAVILGRRQIRTLGFDLEAEVTAFRQALVDHAKTVNVPAPRSHEVVEAIIQENGLYQIIEDVVLVETEADLTGKPTVL